MGQEARCTASVGSRSSEGTAHLDSAELRFSGAFKLKIPFASITGVDAKAGTLRITHADGAASFALGPAAEKWALKIRYPRGRLDKLGIKAGSIVSVLNVDDEGFREEVSARTEAVSFGRMRKQSTIVIFGATGTAALAKLASLREAMAVDGALWVVWPKGQKALREDDVRAAARAEGLVDVKVMSFSDTLSGLKLVIPVAQRPAAQRPAARPAKPRA
jgi:hypothetical protein